MSTLLREHAEQQFAAELAALAEVDDRPRPPRWKLSPWAVATYLLGGNLKNGFEVTPKYIGNARLIEIAVSTLATDLREPSGAVVLDGDVVVVESARHRLTRLRLPEEAVQVASAAHRTQRPATEVAPGAVELAVVFTAPAGQKLDDRYGPSTRLLVSATPPELLVSGAGGGTELRRELVLDPAVAEGVLHVSAMAASCDDDPANEYPACHVHQQDWGVPVRVTEGGAARLPLVLAGLDA